MARRKQPDRVVCIEDRGGDGPRRFRLHVVSGGKRVARGFPSLAEAEAAGQKYTKETAPLRTERVSDLLERYEADMLARGDWQADSAALSRRRGRLVAFFSPVADLAIGMVTPSHLTSLCRAWDATRPGNVTRTDARTKARAFLAWCVRQRLIRTTPFGDEHRIKDAQPVRFRLRMDDARRLRQAVEPAAMAGDCSAALVMLCMLVGPRTSEIPAVTVDDLDDAGRILVIRDAKDKVTVRGIRLPAVLAAALAVMARNAVERGDGLLFGPMSPRERRRRPAKVVREWGRRAGIRDWEKMDVRCLRRTKDTLAVESGLAAEVVARETGHSAEVARKHYIGAGAEASGRAAALADITAPVVPIGSPFGTSEPN
jgi:integrase